MANQSKSTNRLDKLKRWMGGCCWMSASSESKNVPPLACESKHATTSSVASFSNVRSQTLIIERDVEREEGMSVEDKIERFKVHCSELREHTNDEEELAEVSNKKVFESLQRHPTWGRFFRRFGDGGINDDGKLELGEKFAEGGQAKLYYARVTWKNAKDNSFIQEHGYRYVLKVFRRGTLLRDLQKQWPQGMFRDYKDMVERGKLGKSQRIKLTSEIVCGTLLPDGRFAFLLVRETKDLRTLIDRNMKATTSLHSRPFSMEIAFKIMYFVARGIDWLHNLDIVHRDLKASNVLYTIFNKNRDKDGHSFYVADYECSVGVVGTGFFRAPKILQAIKDKVVNERPNLFTKASDIYSYGMVCYEILTGKIPFEGHPTYDFDLVLSGQQPEVPRSVDKWVCKLLRRCWQFDSVARPTIRQILKVLEDNSKHCLGLKREIEEIQMLPREEQVNYKYDFES